MFGIYEIKKGFKKSICILTSLFLITTPSFGTRNYQRGKCSVDVRRYLKDWNHTDNNFIKFDFGRRNSGNLKFIQCNPKSNNLTDDSDVPNDIHNNCKNTN